jgi:hypothetical protein
MVLPVCVEALVPPLATLLFPTKRLKPCVVFEEVMLMATVDLEAGVAESSSSLMVPKPPVPPTWVSFREVLGESDCMPRKVKEPPEGLAKPIVVVPV